MNKEIEKIEPSADMRQMANVIAQLYKSLLDEGFTPDQAIVLAGNVFKRG